jgi:hypothetical protein
MDTTPSSVPSTRPGRRGVLTAAMVALVAGGTHLGGRALGRLGPLARPAGAGTSTSRCAQCGSRDHTMLSGDCPAAPGVV